ncbi:hypothetical protein T440DRAFT_403462 [Plenodomus tracheiphilus IPT5]|uniref:DUF3835 domain-containing protein n=1 Tax=Plenodomus tracheiphilus IPT5 TaxID=1408161 RepID=A0A6A7AVX8_9PLEO|nr:hypothetical protein T440DRAFT_403462 [Plenodomus tracheiphilus IPT5]
MAASAQHVLEGIERRRVELQANIEKLQKALHHWTTWEAEYEALKEELQRGAQDASPAQMRDTARELGGTLLNEKEFEEMLGKDLKIKRSANQVVDILSRRIDYVQQNSASIEKQLDAAEKQLAGVDVLLEPGLDNEEGLPMMDIEEELDDAGNEVSSVVNQTGKGAAEVVEALRRAGMKKADLETKPEAHNKENVSTSATPTMLPEMDAPSQSTTASSGSAESILTPSAKSVSFVEEESKRSKPSSAKEALEQNGFDEDLATLNFSTGTKVIQLDNNDDMVASYPIIPQGESPEDAELRRQMLQYGLSEVGKVVAELDLDHPTVYYSDDDDVDGDSDFNDYGTETEDEEEDEYGRTTKPVVTEEYRRQMLELEKKLGARMLENVGPQADEQPLAEHVSDIRTMRVRKDDEFDQSLDMAQSGTSRVATNEGPRQKMGVRFAENLDISEAPPYDPKPVAGGQTVISTAPTISENIVERAVPRISSARQPPKGAKASRFKSARAGSNAPPNTLPMPAVAQAPAVPTGPTGRPLASTITEHIPGPAEPQAPDEFDPVLLHREVQAEYHRARNTFIQQQGGFKATEEDEERPIVEERDGTTKRVSRFMTARLKAEVLSLILLALWLVCILDEAHGTFHARERYNTHVYYSHYNGS